MLFGSRLKYYWQPVARTLAVFHVFGRIEGEEANNLGHRAICVSEVLLQLEDCAIAGAT
jgi:hypothetical protein